MNFLVCPDSFKGSLDSCSISNIISEAIKHFLPKANISEFPLADGGENSLSVLQTIFKGIIKQSETFNSLGEKVIVNWLDIDGSIAVIEVAEIIGLDKIPKTKRNPFNLSSYGVGFLIHKLLSNKYSKIIVCLGGTGTVDGGAGCLQALGIDFLKNGELITEFMTGNNIGNVTSISTEHFLDFSSKEIVILSDVNNQLFGKNGTVYTYALQKGANKSDLPVLENNIINLYSLLEVKFNPVKHLDGSGSAGGLGAALLNIPNSKIFSGIDYITKNSNFEELIKKSDYIFTGEGYFDKQTNNGKVISKLIDLSCKYNKKLVIISGGFDNKIDLPDNISVFSICNEPMFLDKAIQNVSLLIYDLVKNITKLIK